MNAKVLLLLFFLLLFITPQYVYGQVCDPARPHDPTSPGKGLVPGKCGKIGALDTCRSTMFALVKQNRSSRPSIMFPVTGSNRSVTPQEVKGIVLKYFGHTSFTIKEEVS